LLHLLETQEEQDRWLIENRTAVNAKIRRGIAQLDRGEGIPEDALDAYLTEQKTKPERMRRYILAPEAARDLVENLALFEERSQR
jgi:hypothetical protein